jgi:hypothetical protein
MQIIRLPRRGGKTTKCLEILRDNEKSVMFCHVSLAVLHLEHEILDKNPEIKKRIFTTNEYEQRLRGMNIDTIVIDNADLMPTSVLLGMINYFVSVPLMGQICKLVITTTE